MDQTKTITRAHDSRVAARLRRCFADETVTMSTAKLALIVAGLWQAALVAFLMSGCKSLDPNNLQTPVGIYRFQSPDRTPPPVTPTLDDISLAENPDRVDPNSAAIVANVVIKGNKTVPEHRLLRNIRTRPGRYFDPDMLQQDVDQLWRMKEIKRVNGPYIQETSDGIIVTIEVVEKQLVTQVEFVGNRAVSDRALKKHTNLEDGQPLDIYEVRMLKTRLEEFYRDKGYPKTQVEILDGDQPNDDKIVFLIHEDQQQRVWNVQFEGNQIATDERLKTFIKSKPGVFKVFGGLVKRDEIDLDLSRLMNYYRSLGYFNARIGREITESNDGRWMTLRFIIDEGPRYRVRNVAFVGNTKFDHDQLLNAVKLKPLDAEPPDFNSAKMDQDVVTLRDLYGSQGYVFAQVEAEPRFLEEPGLIDLVYKIDEGEQYRVGKINVHIDGNHGVTRREVVLNRLGIHPGDKIDVRELRASERRLGAAQIFAGADPSLPGAPPRIVVRPPELQALERLAAEDDEIHR